MATRMGTARVEGPGDGVIAITIMVMEFEVPEGAVRADLMPPHHVALSCVLSFVDLGMRCADHHHLMRPAPGVDGTVLRADLHDLFRFSLIPFATAWMGRGGFAPAPTALRGASLPAAAVARRIPEWRVEAPTPRGSVPRRAMGVGRKGRVSVAACPVGIARALAIPRGGGGDLCRDRDGSGRARSATEARGRAGGGPSTRPSLACARVSPGPYRPRSPAHERPP